MTSGDGMVPVAIDGAGLSTVGTALSRFLTRARQWRASHGKARGIYRNGGAPGLRTLTDMILVVCPVCRMGGMNDLMVGVDNK